MHLECLQVYEACETKRLQCGTHLHATVVFQQRHQVTVLADLVLDVPHQGADAGLIAAVGVSGHAPLQEVLLLRILFQGYKELCHLVLLLMTTTRTHRHAKELETCFKRQTLRASWDICDRVTHGVNDAAQPLENEHGRPVVVQVVPLCRLYADGHEGFGFRLRTCERHTPL